MVRWQCFRAVGQWLAAGYRSDEAFAAGLLLVLALGGILMGVLLGVDFLREFADFAALSL